MAVPLAAGGVLVALLLYAQSKRMFARFENGVFLSAAATIVTVALIATAVIGTWGYEAARRIMRAEMTVSLDSIASIIQQQLDLEVRRSTDRLAGLSRRRPRRRSRRAATCTTSRPASRRSSDFNPHYLEFDVIDASGKIVASSEAERAGRGPRPIASAPRSISTARPSSPSRRRSPVYKREVDLRRRAGEGRVRRASSARWARSSISQTVFEEVIKFDEVQRDPATRWWSAATGTSSRIPIAAASARTSRATRRSSKACAAASGEVVAPNAAGDNAPVLVPADDESAEPSTRSRGCC